MILNALPLVALLSRPLQISESTVTVGHLQITCSMNATDHILCFCNKEYPDEPLGYFNANTRALEVLDKQLEPEINTFLGKFNQLLDAVDFGK